jgi:hypothetical protein
MFRRFLFAGIMGFAAPVAQPALRLDCAAVRAVVHGLHRLRAAQVAAFIAQRTLLLIDLALPSSWEAGQPPVNRVDRLIRSLSFHRTAQRSPRKPHNIAAGSEENA